MEYIWWYVAALLLFGVGGLVVTLLIIGAITMNLWLIVAGIVIGLMFSNG